jgi:hypothetical protein
MMIFEAIVTTVSAAGVPHVAPMGVRYPDDAVVLMPFKPSTTLDNVLATQNAVLNLTTDVRVFAGCVTGRREWPLAPASLVKGMRLASSLGHVELQLESLQDDPQRPVLTMSRAYTAHHADFTGFNRAQAAVIEGAVLVSRLRMLPAEKIDTEMNYLQIAIDKTAGQAEHEAWQWLRDAIAAFRARTPAGSTP